MNKFLFMFYSGIPKIVFVDVDEEFFNDFVKVFQLKL